MRGVRRIHFVGLGGIGMSAIAEVLHAQGFRVSGSDLRDGAALARLRALGVDAVVGHDARNVPDADVVVFSSAIGRDNPELVAARERGIAVVHRAEMLAELMRGRDGVAVSGSHGKTTTTGLVAHVLAFAGLDPTAVVGGRVIEPGGAGADRSGARLGTGDVVVVEADESDGSFLRLPAAIAVVTNVDREHVDHYGSFESVQDAFVEFANGVPFWGAAVLCLDDPGAASILPRLTRRAITYGLREGAEWTASDLERRGFATAFRARRDGKDRGDVTVPLPGPHNVANALAAIAVACELGIPFGTAAAGLATYPGIERRFERKGEAAGVLVIDDYAHNPAKVRAVLAAARAGHDGRVVAVFQPHRYTRTRDSFDAFATAFGDADRVVVTEVYAAGEAPIEGFDGAAVADAIRAKGHGDVRFESSLDEVARRLPAELERGDLVITLGAGDVSRIGASLLAALGRGEDR